MVDTRVLSMTQSGSALDSETRRFFSLAARNESRVRNSPWLESSPCVVKDGVAYRKKACVHGLMSILHETFAELVLATEDTWRAGRSQPHKAASKP